MYSNKQAIPVTSDMVLVAIWGYEVVWWYSVSSAFYNNDSDLPNTMFDLYINDTKQRQLTKAEGRTRSFILPRGTKLKVYVGAKYNKSQSFVAWNNNILPPNTPGYVLSSSTSEGKGVTANYTFTLTSNLDMHHLWSTSGIVEPVPIDPRSWWVCYITTK
jgi:hypothetical protein